MASEDGGPAHPVNGPNGNHPGMSLREYAAITLRVPNSGTDWLDAMILESLRNDAAIKAMQATQISEVMEAFRRNDYDGKQSHNAYAPITEPSELAEESFRIANDFLAARKEAADGNRD